MFNAVIVNGRAPNCDSQCSVCGNTVGAGYIRNLKTRAVYDSYQCFAMAERRYDKFRGEQNPDLVPTAVL